MNQGAQRGLLTRRARIAMDAWNLTHPDQPIPWEWLEEVILAVVKCRQAAYQGDEDAFTKAGEHLLQFTRRVPEEVLNAIRIK